MGFSDAADGFGGGGGGGGGGESLAQTLAIGNTSGANDVVLSSGRQINGGRANFGTVAAALTDGDVAAGLTGAGRWEYDQSLETVTFHKQSDGLARLSLNMFQGNVDTRGQFTTYTGAFVTQKSELHIGGLDLASDGAVDFSSTTASSGVKDAALARSAPGVLKSTDAVGGEGRFQVGSFTVATLPAVAPAGQVIFVSDETGGATLAFSDGTNFRRVQDRAIVA